MARLENVTFSNFGQITPRSYCFVLKLGLNIDAYLDFDAFLDFDAYLDFDAFLDLDSFWMYLMHFWVCRNHFRLGSNSN